MNPVDRGMLTTTRKETVLPPGKKFLIGIGIDKYVWAPPLRNAVKDLKDLEKRLTEQYDFNSDNVRLLTDEQATRENIFQLLDDFTQPDVLASNDSLLIYFSGHGYLNHNLQGAWVPVDGKIGVVSSMIQNIIVQDYITQFKCRHVLLISDSCYSGSLQSKAAFTSPKNSMADELEKKVSRYVLSSGRANETTLDSTVANPGNSPFASAMLSALKNNPSPKLLADKLFDSVRDITYNNSPQIPQFQVVSGAGDHGGRFVFTLRDPEPGAWAQAELDKTTKAYEYFIAAFPDSRHRKLAEDRISDLLKKKDPFEDKTYAQIQAEWALMSPPEHAHDLLTQKTHEWAMNGRSWWHLLNFFHWRFIESQRTDITNWGDNKETKEAFLLISKRWWYSWMTVGAVLVISGLAYIGYDLWLNHSQGGAFNRMEQMADEDSKSENVERKTYGISSIASLGYPDRALQLYLSLPEKSQKESAEILPIISQAFLRLNDTTQARLTLDKSNLFFDKLIDKQRKVILEQYISIATRDALNKAFTLSSYKGSFRKDSWFYSLFFKMYQKFYQQGDFYQAQKTNNYAQKVLIQQLDVLNEILSEPKSEPDEYTIKLQSSIANIAYAFYRIGDTLHSKSTLSTVWQLLRKGPTYYNTYVGYQTGNQYEEELKEIINVSTTTNYKPDVRISKIAIDSVDIIDRPLLLALLSQANAKLGYPSEAKINLDKAMDILKLCPLEQLNKGNLNWNKIEPLLEIAIGFFYLEDLVNCNFILKSSIATVDSIQGKYQPEAYMNIAAAYILIGDSLSAKRILRKSLQSSQANKFKYLPVYQTFVENFIKLDDREGLHLVLDNLTNLVRIHPKQSTYVYIYKGYVANGFAKLNDSKGLELILSQSELDSNNAKIFCNLVVNFAQKGNFKQSLHLLDTLPLDKKAEYLFKALFAWHNQSLPEKIL